MSVERIVAIVSSILAILGVAFSAYFFMDERHTGYTDNAKEEVQKEREGDWIEIERKFIESDKDRNEKIRVFYETKEDAEGNLNSYDKRRYEQILRDIDRQEQKLMLLEQYERPSS